jgi:anti-sigma-K factor RskA
MKNAHVLDSLPAYALGALEGDELLEVARHLPGCPECRAALAVYWQAADALPQTLPQRIPPPHLRARVTARVAEHSARTVARNTGAESAATGRQNGWPGWLARFFPRRAAAVGGLAFILLLLAGAVLLQQIIPAQPAVRVVRLAGAGENPEAAGYLMIFPGENNGSLTVDNVPALEAGFQYQAWLIKNGERTSGGVFSVNEEGYGVLQITADHPLDSFDGLGVTVEPEGGSPGPTGERILGGDL